MATPQRSPSAKMATVASCAATDCTHNDHNRCHSASVQVVMQDGRAVCGTYAPEKPKVRP